ncbi:hypothetical protein D3C81_144840 [compost metagenome]|uniref:DUF2177 family protein n=1 Tax=unclassified Janthinobacterium TaxID=2610881 RepID=UPI000C8498BB|nr:DUF2177 family protein [Janthinobacterium sp. AD80]PMQ08064.1 hypothetical protein JaAD80_27475 [Janthinobacterium sp. AD80]
MPAPRPLQLAVAYGAALLAFLAIDALWLAVLMQETYAQALGPLLAAQPRWTPAVLFYVLYLLGLLVFAMAPALRAGSGRRAAALGGLLGLVAYGTYDLSNYATLQAWPLALTVIDMAWGSVLSATAATAGYLAASRLVRNVSA